MKKKFSGSLWWPENNETHLTSRNLPLPQSRQPLGDWFVLSAARYKWKREFWARLTEVPPASTFIYSACFSGTEFLKSRLMAECE